MSKVHLGRSSQRLRFAKGSFMDKVFLGTVISNRPNSQRVARLLREMQTVCIEERRTKVVPQFKGTERRIGNFTPRLAATQ